MTTKQKDLGASIKQACTALVVLAFAIVFVASCAQVAPADPVAKATPTAEPANPEADKAEVRKLLDDHAAAMVRVDTATLDRLWADDIVLIDHEGNTWSKRQWLD